MISLMLPNEIRNLIIELLIDHPNKLKDCRLVSKSWNQRAQQLLFRNFDAEINVGSGLDVCLSRALLDLLESSHSTLKNDIRNLSIIGVAKFWAISRDRLGTDSDEGFSEKCHAVQLLNEFLPRILALRLSKVEHFRLENIYWTKSSQLKSILASFTEVTTITWRSVATEDPGTSRDVLLCLFNQTNLDQLVLSNVHLYQNSTSPLMPSPHNPLQLSSITTVEITVEETVLPVLNAFVTVPPRIRNLTLEMTEKSASHSTDVGNLLHHLGDVLLSLTLCGPQRHTNTSLPHDSIPPTRTMAISLSNNHALECLTFKGFLFHSAHPIPTSANQGMILDLLETIKAFTLKEVTISASLTGEDASSDFAGIFDMPARITSAPPHIHRFRFSLTGGTKNSQPYYRQLIVSNLTHAGVELWNQGRLACDLNGEELLLVKSTMVNEVAVDDEGMSCTGWPHSSTPVGPLPGEEDEL